MIQISIANSRPEKPYLTLRITGKTIMKTPLEEKTLNQPESTHSVFMGYLLWIFGFIGAHRFYYGKQLSDVNSDY